MESGQERPCIIRKLGPGHGKPSLQSDTLVNSVKREAHADTFEFHQVTGLIVIWHPVVFTPVDDDLSHLTTNQQVFHLPVSIVKDHIRVIRCRRTCSLLKHQGWQGLLIEVKRSHHVIGTPIQTCKRWQPQLSSTNFKMELKVKKVWSM